MHTLLIFLLLSQISSSEALMAEQDLIDAGVVRTGPQLSREFVLKNNGSVELEIVSAESGCGCVKPVFAQQVLPAGESTRLTVIVNTLTQPAGRQSWKTVVRYRERSSSSKMLTEQGTLELRLTAELIREVSVQPPELAISTESTARQLIKLIDIREQPLRILQVATSHPAMTVKLLQDSGSKAEQQLELVLDERYPVRSQAETIRIITSDPACRELTVPVNVTKHARSPFRVVPQDILFRLGEQATTTSRLIQIRHSQNTPLRIESIESDTAEIAAKWSTGSGLVATVRVTLEPTKTLALKGTAFLKVRFAEPVGEMLLIPINWTR